MRTEQPTKCFVPLHRLRARLDPIHVMLCGKVHMYGARKRFKPPSNSLLTVPRRWFCCVSLLPVFGVIFRDISPYVCRFGLSSGHLLGKSRPLG